MYGAAVHDIPERKAAALKVLRIAEDVARDDMACDFCEEDVSEFNKLQSTLKTLRNQSISSAWKPEFVKALMSSTGMRIMKVKGPAVGLTKEVLRNWSGKCMACGRRECCNDAVVHLAGDFDEDSFKTFERLGEDWKRYIDNYNECLNIGNNSKRSMKTGELFHQDHGAFILGKTCTRLSSLAYICNTFFPDMIFNAAQTIKERRQVRSAVKPNHNYSCEEDDIFLHLTSLDRIKSLVANNEELASNAVPMDIAFWKSIGNSRKFASCNDTQWLAKMLYTQTYKTEVSSPEQEDEQEEEQQEEEEDGVEDEDDDDDDYDDDDDDDDDFDAAYECDKKKKSPPISVPAGEKRSAEMLAEEPAAKAAKVAEATEVVEDKTKVAVKALLKAQQILIAKADLAAAALVSEALVALM